MSSRPLEGNEEKNLIAINNTGTPSALLFLTAAGISHALLDATERVRRFFETAGFHFYERQPQGPEHKVVKRCILALDADVVETTVSLYRPVTKKGDPRLWISGLRDHAKPGDVLALAIKGGDLVVANITQLKPPAILDVAESGSTYSFLDQIISENFVAESSARAAELVEKLREISKRSLPAEVDADTAVGRAIETALGIQINSSKSPDYKGIELKSSRELRSANRSGLFAKVADWEISSCKSSKEILERHGYEKNGIRRLYCTIKADRPNSQGLFIVKTETELREMCKIAGKNVPVCAWKLSGLHDALLTKHKETFWLKAESFSRGKSEYFRLKSAIHTKIPSVTHFDTMLESGDITVDHLIKQNKGKASVTEGGPQFKVSDAKRPQLFLGKQKEYIFS
jgi:hypothetical protein